MPESIDNRTLGVLEDASVPSVSETKTTTLSSGVVLEHINVPPMILAKIDERYPDPPIPMVYHKDQERSIPNPDDPNYHRAVEDNRTAKGNALVDVIIALGTKLVYIPVGMQSPDDEEWVNDLELFGIDVPKLKVGRYLAWVKYYAAQTVEDFQAIAKKGSRALGVTEEEVATAIANFQDTERRPADTERTD